MKKRNNLATVISYCTNDDRFLDLCIKESFHFSSQVIVVVADHFFNGEPENRALINSASWRHPGVQFVQFAYNPKETYGLHCPVRPGDEEWAHYWHSTSRYIGQHFIDDDIDTILFADVDEVHDGKRVSEWLDTFDYRSYNAIRLASYFYFRSACYRALSWLPSSLILRREAIASEELLDLWERQGILEGMVGRKMKQAVGLDGKPLVHHFSWVKPKEEMLKKVKSWGHSHEKDWASLVELEFSSPFRGVDMFYGLHYEEVESWRDPLAFDAVVGSEEEAPNLLKVDPKSLFRLSILKKKP